jgi:hypothetical protein
MGNTLKLYLCEQHDQLILEQENVCVRSGGIAWGKELYNAALDTERSVKRVSYSVKLYST